MSREDGDVVGYLPSSPSLHFGACSLNPHPLALLLAPLTVMPAPRSNCLFHGAWLAVAGLHGRPVPPVFLLPTRPPVPDHLLLACFLSPMALHFSLTPIACQCPIQTAFHSSLTTFFLCFLLLTAHSNLPFTTCLAPPARLARTKDDLHPNLLCPPGLPTYALASQHCRSPVHLRPLFVADLPVRPRVLGHLAGYPTHSQHPMPPSMPG